jgi:hypothetical protein
MIPSVNYMGLQTFIEEAVASTWLLARRVPRCYYFPKWRRILCPAIPGILMWWLKWETTQERSSMFVKDFTGLHV